MFPFIFEHVVAFWRAYILPSIVIILSTMLIYMGLATQEYIDQSEPYAAHASVSDADIRIFNTQLPARDFLRQVENLHTVRLAYSPTSLWGMVMTAAGSAHLNIKSVPPKSLRIEDFYQGTYPTTTDEIALPTAVAQRLKVSLGDSVLLTIPAVGKHGTLRQLTVCGVYSYSPLNRNFQSLFNAIVGLDTKELWIDTAGKQPIDNHGILVSGRPSVGLDKLKESVLSIPGTIVQTREEAYEKYLTATRAYVANLQGSGRALLIVPLLATILTLYYTGRHILRTREREYRLLVTMGATQTHIFILAFLQLPFIGIAAITIGMLLGHIGGKLLHALIQLLPGLHFLLPYFQPSLMVSIQTIVVMIAAVSAATIAAVWNATYLPLFHFAKNTRTSPMLLRVTNWFGTVFLTTALLVLAALATRRGQIPDTWATYHATIALLSIAFLTLIAMVAHVAVTHQFRDALTRGKAPLSVSLRPREAGAFDVLNNSLFSSRLVVTSVAMLVVALTTNASSAHLVNTIADEISPYDIAVSTDEENGVMLNDDVIHSVLSYPGVKNTLLVYSANVHIKEKGADFEPFDMNIRSVDRRAAEKYFADDDHADIPERGIIQIPSDVMRYLNIHSGDALALPAADGGAVSFKVQRSASPWIVMELADFHLVKTPNVVNELWVKAQADQLKNFANFFVDFRTSIVTNHLTDEFRVKAGITLDILTIAEKASWTLPILTGLIVYAIVAAVIALLSATSYCHGRRRREARLLSSMGVPERHIRRGYMIESYGLVLIDMIIGTLLGLAAMPMIWFDLLGLRYHKNLAFPFMDIVLILGGIMVFTGIFAFTRSLCRRP
ncbi:ABC transporter permease [Arcanobacterium haemolyticum]|uniref:ABC3 transporter permease C-terminal domain-containing protein n=1 Tax=Arcanobacterium haemolyticum (strain ATCC 9345 / DSM 20595 / CCM 5947 / CCUG 17215 / LMG 16163 / NBRC 15585 / NCTC 8452 / 11018) TaxID=644284 RepID=D7BML8_ARCHD|nr:ABC transporter permease [Arcanobacterium haemolyticum]ADH92167.1 protein of unknown function DUF214 [Arcanobacterium haemolyticum DSM 20595]SQH29128.1 FtsX-like permease family [Arcanobacterium haemolyticum]